MLENVIAFISVVNMIGGRGQVQAFLAVKVGLVLVLKLNGNFNTENEKDQDGSMAT